MYTDVNQSEFISAFRRMDRSENFTHTALIALYDYLTQIEEDTGEEFELDVIALCCEYGELTACEFEEQYPDVNPDDCEHIIAKLDNGHYLLGQF